MDNLGTSFPASARIAQRGTSARLARWALLILIVLVFARLTWALGAKNLWWDESLSLLRAESDWHTLLLGRIVLSDGIHQTLTIDQHPFGFFVLLGILVRLAGKNEFVLRFPAAMASTLLVPALWVQAHYLVRRGVVPAATPYVAALLAALNPFYLWYGQEARMYTLVALLAILSTYSLLRWAEASNHRTRRRFLFGYTLTIAYFLTIHYFAVLLLPVHAVIFHVRLAQRDRRLATAVAALLLGIGLVIGLIAAWIILSQPRSGVNFQPISLAVLVPDLLNAFSLGLSVDIAQAWWLDLVFGAAALVGLLWSVRRRRSLLAGGWLLPAFILTPILLLLAINQVQPAYMNARHMGLISGAFLLLVASGIALAWQWQRWLGGAVMLLLVGGMLYSTYNYFVLPEYGKDDFAELGQYLRREMLPGDLLLLDPPELLRLYRYYLPLDLTEPTGRTGAEAATAWQGVPVMGAWDDTAELLQQQLSQHQRIWLVTSGMFPFSDPEKRVEGWLRQNAFWVRESKFHSTTSYLELQLFLPAPPLVDRLPDTARRVDAQFADSMRLVGYELGQPLSPDSMVPLTLYWQALKPMEQRYKYVANLAYSDATGHSVMLPATEREPYDGFLPTVWWPLGSLVVERSAVVGPDDDRNDNRERLLLEVYNSETLRKLPLRSTRLGEIGSDGYRLILPSSP